MNDTNTISSLTFINLDHQILRGIKPTFQPDHKQIAVIFPSANLDLNNNTTITQSEIENTEHYIFDVAEFLHNNMSGHDFRTLIDALQYRRNG